MAELMQAWRNERYGSASGARLHEIPVPEPRPGEVLVRVRATALNAGDVRLMLGDPLLVRPVFGLTRPKYAVRGMDIAGEIVAAGANAIGVEIGEQVIGELFGGGGLAEYATIPAERVVPVPPGVTAEAAACLPVAAGTAWQALDLAGVGAGSPTPRVLVIGASGGVGTFAVQLAALRGAEVWATCAARNAAVVERLGAVRTLDHRREPLSAIPGGRFDAVIDIAGGIALRDLRRLTAPGGAVVLVTGDGGHILGPVPRMLKAAFLSLTPGPRIRPLTAASRPEVLTRLLELLSEGRIAPVIAQEYPFAEASAALARLEDGHVVGKLVVRGT
ncbi:NAD(P)-dependent alcohol dehydrogenase [Microbacterium hydrocarbonoxydans]|uniref:NAD(P)-dependent alcohol dehydrogenase n=1 Tax=Microbacterium hydrocarbonoxydans TaxID=273678 RepID=UPI0007BB7201|nr:NAD(P)-dependent alcohol dehydrogenase [Microbacterium hydrocarbonoxydans]GAT74145.1 alcohol dehydrogenase zinc-binding domain-containing protein [Microbacterium sp. HM58-2]